MLQHSEITLFFPPSQFSSKQIMRNEKENRPMKVESRALPNDMGCIHAIYPQMD